MKNILKPILIILGLVALAAVVYFYFIQQPVEAPLTRTSTTGTTVSATEERQLVSEEINIEEFQRLLSQLDAIDLNGEVFLKPQYMQLVDHTQTALIKLDETKAIAPLSKDNPFQGLGFIAPVIMLQGTATPQVTPRSR